MTILRVLWIPGLRNEEKAPVKAQHHEIFQYPDRDIAISFPMGLGGGAGSCGSLGLVRVDHLQRI